MRGSRAVLAWACLAPAAAAAGELELGVFAGPSIPTYEQSFAYDPGALHPPVPLPGITISEDGTFGLTAKGGLAAGASLAFSPPTSSVSRLASTPWTSGWRPRACASRPP